MNFYSGAPSYGLTAGLAEAVFHHRRLGLRPPPFNRQRTFTTARPNGYR